MIITLISLVFSCGISPGNSLIQSMSDKRGTQLLAAKDCKVGNSLGIPSNKAGRFISDLHQSKSAPQRPLPPSPEKPPYISKPPPS
ncbi:hypothetical protein GWI33_003554 [Rhynchophorus ferrugineus]|uniref:Uncharacterized protein n=1 Tax=Rhynchophorus ferrugineus TaxID=354439 RepID=A0A834HRF7_RHYFE|nr:hypothetical protein GWI33_003554 [Rhynchophorus ferrugineus]